MCAALKVGLVAPNRWAGAGPAPAELGRFLREVDDWGFDSLWVTDRLIHPTVSMLSPFILLTYVAAHTTRVRLGTGVFLLPLRHPFEIARQAASLDHLSGGRLTMGVSLGGRREESRAVQAPVGDRPGQFEESLAILRGLWRGEPFAFHGRHFDLDVPASLPAPVQRGGIPIMIGAGSRSDVGLRRAGRLADGWVMGTPGPMPADFARGWGIVREGAIEAGRDPATLRSAKLVYATVDDDPTRARREMEAEIERYYGPAKFPHAIITGPAQAIVDEILAFGEAGCELVILVCPGGDLAKMEHLSRIPSMVAGQ